MTALEIAMAGCLAFGQPTGNYYEAITTHSGLQVIHSDGAVTLRLREQGTGNGERIVENGDGSKTTVIRLRDERYPFEGQKAFGRALRESRRRFCRRAASFAASSPRRRLPPGLYKCGGSFSRRFCRGFCLFKASFSRRKTFLRFKIKFKN